MYIKIYFNSKPLFLCDSMNAEIKAYATHDDAIYIDEFSTAAVNSMIHEMKQEKVHAGIFVYQDLKKLQEAFFRKFTLIRAGGGLVQNEKNETLFIFRRGTWDLPKGKLDEGETIEACALREVKEETGLSQLRMGGLILTSYHVYDENGSHFLKETSWFSMTSESPEKLTPQIEEQITEIRWIPRDELPSLLSSTFPLVRDVAGAAGIAAH